MRKIVAHSGRSRGRGWRERVHSRRGAKRKNIRDARRMNKEREEEKRKLEVFEEEERGEV